MENDTQLASKIFHRVMSIMKFSLNLEEYSYREKGRDDPRYKTFKQQLMANTYENLRGLWNDLAKDGLIESTDNGEDVKGGYKPTESGGSGYVNTSELNNWMEIE